MLSGEKLAMKSSVIIEHIHLAPSKCYTKSRGSYADQRQRGWLWYKLTLTVREQKFAAQRSSNHRGFMRVRENRVHPITINPAVLPLPQIDCYCVSAAILPYRMPVLMSSIIGLMYVFAFS